MISKYSPVIIFYTPKKPGHDAGVLASAISSARSKRPKAMGAKKALNAPISSKPSVSHILPSAPVAPTRNSLPLALESGNLAAAFPETTVGEAVAHIRRASTGTVALVANGTLMLDTPAAVFSGASVGNEVTHASHREAVAGVLNGAAPGGIPPKNWLECVASASAEAPTLSSNTSDAGAPPLSIASSKLEHTAVEDWEEGAACNDFGFRNDAASRNDVASLNDAQDSAVLHDAAAGGHASISSPARTSTAVLRPATLVHSSHPPSTPSVAHATCVEGPEKNADASNPLSLTAHPKSKTKSKPRGKTSGVGAGLLEWGDSDRKQALAASGSGGLAEESTLTGSATIEACAAQVSHACACGGAGQVLAALCESAVESEPDVATLVRGGLSDYVKTQGLWNGLEDVIGNSDLGLAGGQDIQTGGGERRGGMDACQKRLNDLESIVCFREWEAKCMRQDIKTALNTSLWGSINGPLLHAVSQHVSARRSATLMSLQWRRRHRLLHQHFAAVLHNARVLRCRRRRCARAELLRTHHNRSVLGDFLMDWSGIAMSKSVEPPRLSNNALPAECTRAASATRLQEDAKGSPDSFNSQGTCFGCLFRCMGRGEGRETSTRRSEDGGCMSGSTTLRSAPAYLV